MPQRYFNSRRCKVRLPLSYHGTQIRMLTAANAEGSSNTSIEASGTMNAQQRRTQRRKAARKAQKQRRKAQNQQRQQKQLLGHVLSAEAAPGPSTETSQSIPRSRNTTGLKVYCTICNEKYFDVCMKTSFCRSLTQLS